LTLGQEGDFITWKQSSTWSLCYEMTKRGGGKEGGKFSRRKRSARKKEKSLVGKVWGRVHLIKKKRHSHRGDMRGGGGGLGFKVREKREPRGASKFWYLI